MVDKKSYEYSVNEVPPPAHLLLSAFQHVLIMFVAIGLPVIFAGQINETPAFTATLVTFSMLSGPERPDPRRLAVYVLFAPSLAVRIDLEGEGALVNRRSLDELVGVACDRRIHVEPAVELQPEAILGNFKRAVLRAPEDQAGHVIPEALHVVCQIGERAREATRLDSFPKSSEVVAGDAPASRIADDGRDHRAFVTLRIADFEPRVEESSFEHGRTPVFGFYRLLLSLLRRVDSIPEAIEVSGINHVRR